MKHFALKPYTNKLFDSQFMFHCHIFLTCVERLRTLVGQELSPLPGLLSQLPFSSGVRLAQYLIFSVAFYKQLVFHSDHDIVCPSVDHDIVYPSSFDHTIVCPCSTYDN